MKKFLIILILFPGVSFSAFTSCPTDTTGTYPNCVYETVSAFSTANGDYYDPIPPYVTDLRTFWTANDFPTEFCAGSGNFHVYNQAITCQYYAVCDGRYLVRHVNNACSAWINAYLSEELWARGTGASEPDPEPEPLPEPTTGVYVIGISTNAIQYIAPTESMISFASFGFGSLLFVVFVGGLKVGTR